MFVDHWPTAVVEVTYVNYSSSLSKFALNEKTDYHSMNDFPNSVL